MLIRCSIFIFILFLFSACTQTSSHSSMQRHSNHVPKSQISETRQVKIITNGGQKIIVPTQKTEVGILWSPPNESTKNIRYAELLDNSYLSNSIIGQIGELETLLASRYLDQLLNKNELLTRKVAKRAMSYLPYIIEEIEKRGLPLELAALPMIESAYISNAVSHAGAAGLWQIMPLTGKELGLEVSRSNDERFNFQKSTKAALDYLEILYKRFNDWPLALSAYNCGPARLTRALRISNTNNLIDLLDYCKKSPKSTSPLKAETQRYVPQFIAAMLALKEIGVLSNTTSSHLNERRKTEPRASESENKSASKSENMQSNNRMSTTQAPLQMQGNYETSPLNSPQTKQNYSQQTPFPQKAPLRMKRVL